uniref:Uncharacterized protein n=1 Tax=Lepeophtheirus salmonis TaxID=72036 RepID=A0A0K2URN6_LEPSM
MCCIMVYKIKVYLAVLLFLVPISFFIASNPPLHNLLSHQQLKSLQQTHDSR